jgi:hypothetical protein
MVHHFGKHLSPLVHVLVGNIYIILPPTWWISLFGVSKPNRYMWESRDCSTWVEPM